MRANMLSHDILHSAVEAGHLPEDVFLAERALNSFFDFAIRDSVQWEEGNPLAILDGPITAPVYGDMREWLASTDKEDRRVLNIQSQGGVATVGIAVFNLLRSAKNVDINVVGEAYSAASLIAQGGANRHVSTGANIGIHPAWIMAYGNKKVMGAAAKRLELMDDLVLNVYMTRAKVSEDEIIKAVDSDTSMAGAEAVRMGLADTAGDDEKNAPDRGMRLPGAKQDDEQNAAMEEVQAAAPTNIVSRFDMRIGSNRFRS